MTAKIEIDKEVIGESPNREFYTEITGNRKYIELVFFENRDQFFIYIEDKNKDGARIKGETTQLFLEALKLIQAKANELEKPVEIVVDPVRYKLSQWCRFKISQVIGGWDKAEAVGHGGEFRKKIWPQKTTNKEILSPRDLAV